MYIYFTCESGSARTCEVISRKICARSSVFTRIWITSIHIVLTSLTLITIWAFALECCFINLYNTVKICILPDIFRGAQRNNMEVADDNVYPFFILSWPPIPTCITKIDQFRALQLFFRYHSNSCQGNLNKVFFLSSESKGQHSCKISMRSGHKHQR